MTNSTAAKLKTDDDKQQVPSGAPAGTKEFEPILDPRAGEAAAVAEIKEIATSNDKEALEALRQSHPEIKQAQPKPEIPPDVADAGVKSIEDDAAAVLTGGPTINLDITEDEYEQGLKMKASGQTDRREKTVFGTASLIALALWVKRIMKLAHKHTMRIVFRKEVKSN